MRTQMLITFALCAIPVFILTALLSRLIIPKLKSLKMGQKILDIGPRWHKNKEGTPTMGGITFISASALVFIIAAIVLKVLDIDAGLLRLIVCVCFALLNGLIGFVDDFAKFFKKQNQGLKAAQKFFLQLVVTALFLFVMNRLGFINDALYFPYFNVKIKLGIAYYIIMMVLITGIINSVNLTDGIDGLASSVTFVVAGFFAVAGFYLSNYSEVILSSLIVGSTLGFLVYNFHPAKIFMGDTGSLFLGGAVVGMAFLINDPLILVLVGIIYICESASDIIQVFYFKITHGKRFFKMAPIHHHFERCGWSENKIVLIFSAVTLVFSVIAFFGLN